MATQVPSQQELYDLYKNEVQSRNPELTDFTDGSKLDSLGGGFSTAGQQIVKFIVDKFAETFFSTAHGPEVTGSSDDLQTLAVDHFGDSFKRPGAEKAVGVVTFTRPLAGPAVSILAGTIVKTVKNANGVEQRFATLIDVTLSGTTINASVQAVNGGIEGNVLANKVIVLETALTDPTVVVNNTSPFTGGEAPDTDAEYREFIRNKIETLRGATKAAIEAAATNVPGVVTATAIEDLQPVIEWDIGSSMPVGSFFRIPRVRLFIADANGTANQALLDFVSAAIAFVRACGVRVNVLASSALTVNWTISVSLNPGGPNFAVLSTNTTLLEDSMAQYIRNLGVGVGFDRGLAKLAIMAIWGPTGTNDLTDLNTLVPTGNITATPTQKLIPGTMEASP
jgi:hypothetical protein